MQPRTGTWSFEDHTTSTWVPANVGIPSPSSGPSAGPAIERDESAIWDDPDEATRKLSSHDLARTLDSATDLEMDWDEDESATNTYSPEHARAMLQTSGEPKRATSPIPRPQSAVRQRAVRPEDFEAPAQAERARPHRANPATAGALASIQPLVHEPEVRQRRPTPSPNVTTTRRKAQPVSASAPRAANPAPEMNARGVKKVLRINPDVAARAQSQQPTARLRPVPVQAPRAAPVPTQRTQQRPAPRPPAPPSARRHPTLQPGALNVAPQPPAAGTGNERAWTHAWEEAQALARTNLQMHASETEPQYAYVQPAEHVQHVQPERQLSHRRGDGPTLLNFPPAQPEPVEAYYPEAHAFEAPAVLQPRAAMHELRAAMPVAPLPFELDEVAPSPTSIQREIKRLAIWSAIPGIALFGAVLVGRVLIAGAGPAPAPVPAAPTAQVAAAALPEPVQPEPTPSAVAPTQTDRRASSHASRSRTRDDSAAARDSDGATRSTSATRATRATHDAHDAHDVSDDSADADSAPAPRATHKPQAAAPEASASDAAPAPVERASAIGILRINSRPWSQVSIDGKVVGNTPQMGLRLRAGTHHVELVNAQLGMRKKFDVQIQADEITTRAEMLEE